MGLQAFLSPLPHFPPGSDTPTYLRLWLQKSLLMEAMAGGHFLPSIKAELLGKSHRSGAHMQRQRRVGDSAQTNHKDS
jgi:hypothetical protein